ncbi:MAG: chemotaxis protein CheB, partial [Comamonadaceae bacterium]
MHRCRAAPEANPIRHSTAHTASDAPARRGPRTEREQLRVEQPDIDVVAITGSAGAFGASLQVLRNLPEGFSLPIVIAFHLPLESSLVQMYARLPFRVEWATPGAMLEPGKVLVCPPRQLLELLPDGSCMLSAADGGAGAKPLDGFLESVARSFASRAIGVVLTGMGNDASVGALELHRAGGHVVVQSEASAEFPSMPAAAIACGAADIVIPLAEMGNLLGELAARTPRLRMRSEVDTIRRVFGATGIVAAHAREVDWSRTPLGPAIDWPETLRVSVRTIMDSPTPQAVWWGPEFVQLYNDAWCRFLGVTGHPQALGGRARDTWSAIWHDVGPLVASVLADGTASTGADYPLLVRRHAYAEEVFASFSYSPIRDAAGSVVGIHNNVWD